MTWVASFLSTNNAQVTNPVSRERLRERIFICLVASRFLFKCVQTQSNLNFNKKKWRMDKIREWRRQSGRRRACMFRLQSVERLKGAKVNQENKGSSFKNLKKLLKFGEKKKIFRFKSFANFWLKRKTTKTRNSFFIRTFSYQNLLL